MLRLYLYHYQIRKLHTTTRNLCISSIECVDDKLSKKLSRKGIFVNHFPLGSYFLIFQGGRSFSCQLSYTRAVVNEIIPWICLFDRRSLRNLLGMACFAPPLFLPTRDESGSPKTGRSLGCLKPDVAPLLFFLLVRAGDLDIWTAVHVAPAIPCH